MKHGCVKLNKSTHSFHKHSLNAMRLALLAHFLSGIEPVEVVDGNVAALFGEGVADDFAEATGWCVLAFRFGFWWIADV
jgi:phosphopantothenate synthetase